MNPFVVLGIAIVAVAGGLFALREKEPEDKDNKKAKGKLAGLLDRIDKIGDDDGDGGDDDDDKWERQFTVMEKIVDKLELAAKKAPAKKAPAKKAPKKKAPKEEEEEEEETTDA